MHGVLKECPNIGKEIETFVSERNVGADAWRTGVLTFDGNRKVKEKVTNVSINVYRKYTEKNFPMAQWYSFVLLETIEDVQPKITRV